MSAMDVPTNVGLGVTSVRGLDRRAQSVKMKFAQRRDAATNEVSRMGSKRRSVTTRADGEITRSRILDSAERLFSIDGFTGVSVRAITTDAEVDLALVNYYFGSKEKLFHEVLIRRVDAMSRKRMDKLRKIRIRKNNPATITELIDAFLAPIVGESKEEVTALRNYRLLIALVTNSKTWQDVVFKEHYDPVATQYIDALCSALPSISRPAITWAFSFFLGSLVNALAETGRVDRLSRGACRSDDLDEVSRRLKEYTVAAFIGLIPKRRLSSKWRMSR